MDPSDELLDLCDDRGLSTGKTKPRSEVHRDGDWHRAFHCWLVDGSDPANVGIVLQQRSLVKFTWPGLWDVSVGGHYTAGEGLEGGLREIQEELGIGIAANELVPAGWRKEEVIHANGSIEREIQDIYFVCRQVDLALLGPDPAEVIAVALLPTGDLRRLADRKAPEVASPAIEVIGMGQVGRTTLLIAGNQLVPRTGRYYRKVADFAERLVGPAHSVHRRWW